MQNAPRKLLSKYVLVIVLDHNERILMKGELLNCIINNYSSSFQQYLVICEDISSLDEHVKSKCPGKIYLFHKKIKGQ